MWSEFLPRETYSNPHTLLSRHFTSGSLSLEGYNTAVLPYFIYYVTMVAWRSVEGWVTCIMARRLRFYYRISLVIRPWQRSDHTRFALDKCRMTMVKNHAI